MTIALNRVYAGFAAVNPVAGNVTPYFHERNGAHSKRFFYAQKPSLWWAVQGAFGWPFLVSGSDILVWSTTLYLMSQVGGGYEDNHEGYVMADDIKPSERCEALFFELFQSIYFISDVNGLRIAADRCLLPDQLMTADYFAVCMSERCVEQIDRHMELLGELREVVGGSDG